MGVDVSKFIEEERKTRSLNLEQKCIVEIPPDVAQLCDHLQRLGLGHNLLHTLPMEMTSLANLRYLNLRGNLFREFPKLCHMPRLEILDLSRNKLRALPDDPGSLLSLKILSVSKNRLRRLPRYVADMKELRILKVQHNQINWPPEDLLEPASEGDNALWLERLQTYLRDNMPPDDDDVSQLQLSQQRQKGREIESESGGSDDDLSSAAGPSGTASSMHTHIRSQHGSGSNGGLLPRGDLNRFIESARQENVTSNLTTSDDGSGGREPNILLSQRRRHRQLSRSTTPQADSRLKTSLSASAQDEELDEFPDTPMVMTSGGTARTRRHPSREHNASDDSTFHLRGASADSLLASSAAVHARRPSTDSSITYVGSASHLRNLSSEVESATNGNGNSVGQMNGYLQGRRPSRDVVTGRLVSGNRGRPQGRRRSQELAFASNGNGHVRGDSYDSTGSLDSQSTHTTTPSLEHTASAPLNAAISIATAQYTSAQVASCERAVEIYFQRITGTTEVDLSTEPGRWLDAGRCMLFALSQAHGTLRTLVAAQPDTSMAVPLNASLRAINDRLHQMVRCLVGFDRHVLQLHHQPGQRLEPGVCAELKKVCLLSVADARKMIGTLRNSLASLTRGMDVRLVRHALLSLQGISFEVRLAAERLPSAAALAPLTRTAQNPVVGTSTSAAAAGAGAVAGVGTLASSSLFSGLARGLARTTMRRTVTAPTESTHRGGGFDLANMPTSPPLPISPSCSTVTSPTAIAATVTVSSTSPPGSVGNMSVSRRPTQPEIRPTPTVSTSTTTTPAEPVASGAKPAGTASSSAAPSAATASHLPNLPRDLERDARLGRAADTCIHAATGAIHQLRSVIAQYSASTTAASNGKSFDSDAAGSAGPTGSRVAEQIGSLMRHVEQASELTQRLQRSLAAFQSEPDESMYRRMFLDDASLFLRAATRVSSAAKGISLVLTLNKPATASLQSLIHSTRGLAVLVAGNSGRLSPRPITRTQTVPSGRSSPIGRSGSTSPGDSEATGTATSCSVVVVDAIPSINVNAP